MATRRRPSVRKPNGKTVRFSYNADVKKYSVVINSQRYDGDADTLAEARRAVRNLLRYV